MSIAGNDKTETRGLYVELGRRDILSGENPAFEKILALGKEAVPDLIKMLKSDQTTVVVDAIRLLQRLKASDAVSHLRTLSQSSWAEVSAAALTALAQFERPATGTLKLDRKDPFGQIGRLSTAIIGSRQDLYPPETLLAFCRESVAVMPSLSFRSKNEEGRSWAMLGNLLFKSLHPTWPGGTAGTEPNSEAARCYQEALRCEVDGLWQEFLRGFTSAASLVEDIPGVETIAHGGQPLTHWLQVAFSPHSSHAEEERAIDALAAIGTPAVAPLLQVLRFERHLTNAQKFPHLATTQALVRIGEPTVPGLTAALQDQDRGVRIWVAFILGKQGRAQETVQLLIKELTVDDAGSLRDWAANALGCLSPEAARGAVAELIRILTQGKDFLPCDAAEALGALGAVEAVEPLIATLKHPYTMVRRYAIEALGQIGDARAVEPLFSALSGDESYSAAHSLAQIKDPRVVERSVALLRDAKLWRLALTILAETSDPAAISPLFRCLDDPSSELSGEAAKALGKLRTPEAVAPLSAALKHRETAVRRSAVEALRRIGDPKAIDPLFDALSGDEGWAAARALATINSPRVIERSTALLRDRQLWKLAIEILDASSDPAAVSPLISSLDDPNGELRKGAAAALARRKAPEGIEPILSAWRRKQFSDQDAHAWLVRITGQDLGLDPSGWQEQFDREREHGGA